MLYLVDTGILLRVFDKLDANHQAIKTAIRLLKSRSHELATTPQNLREFWNVTTRPREARGGYGMTAEQATMRLAALERMYRVLPEHPDVFPAWKQLVSSEKVLGLQVHDANIATTGNFYRANFVLTLNADHFRRFKPLVAVTPAEVVAAA